MNTAELKESLHKKIDAINDETSLKKSNAKNGFILSEHQNILLNDIRARHFYGESKSYSWNEAKKFIKEGGENPQ